MWSSCCCQIPVAARLGTSDAAAAHARLRDSAVRLYDDEVLHLDGAPPMFADPDGNALVTSRSEDTIRWVDHAR